MNKIKQLNHNKAKIIIKLDRMIKMIVYNKLINKLSAQLQINKKIQIIITYQIKINISKKIINKPRSKNFITYNI
jgi:hypothetical protein